MAWCRPEMLLISSAGLSDPRSEIDANCSAATQPSVELWRSVTSALQVQPGNVDQKRPRLRHVETQCADIDFDELVADPHAAERQASPRLLVTTTCKLSQPCSSRKSIEAITAAAVTRCQSSTMTAIGSSRSWISLISDVSTYCSAFSPCFRGHHRDRGQWQDLLAGSLPPGWPETTPGCCRCHRGSATPPSPHHAPVPPPLRGERRLSVSGRRVNHGQSPPFSRA